MKIKIQRRYDRESNNCMLSFIYKDSVGIVFDWFVANVKHVEVSFILREQIEEFKKMITDAYANQTKYCLKTSPSKNSY